MNMTTLRARATAKGARIAKRGEQFQIIDARANEVISTVEGVLALEVAINWLDSRPEHLAQVPEQSTITLTIGWGHHSKMGPQQVVEYRPGHPIAIEGIALDIVIHEDHIEIRGTGTTVPVIRATSANSIIVRPELMHDWRPA